MISLLMLTLSVAPLSGHPKIKTNYPIASNEGLAEKACSTVKSFGQSLKSALVDKDVSMCVDSKAKSKVTLQHGARYVYIFFSVDCTTASLELVKKCLSGIEVDDNCLQRVYKNISEDKDCFCGGLLKFSEMLS